MLELSHVGEILISEILTRSLEARQVMRSAGCAISENLVIVPEVRPNNCGPLAFDGTHRRAEGSSLIELWEHRGPPDYCSKDSGEWVCE